MVKSFQEPWEGGNVTPILQIRKLRLKEGRHLAGSLRNKTQSQNFFSSNMFLRKEMFCWDVLEPPTGVPPGGNLFLDPGPGTWGLGICIVNKPSRYSNPPGRLDSVLPVLYKFISYKFS